MIPLLGDICLLIEDEVAVGPRGVEVPTSESLQSDFWRFYNAKIVGQTSELQLLLQQPLKLH